MILPTKIIKPSDSLVYISSKILSLLSHSSMTVDELHFKINQNTKNSLSLKRVFLGLNFLFIIDKIESENEVIRIKLK
jgi:hypothetical protein